MVTRDFSATNMEKQLELHGIGICGMQDGLFPLSSVFRGLIESGADKKTWIVFFCVWNLQATCKDRGHSFSA